MKCVFKGLKVRILKEKLYLFFNGIMVVFVSLIVKFSLMKKCFMALIGMFAVLSAYGFSPSFEYHFQANKKEIFGLRQKVEEALIKEPADWCLNELKRMSNHGQEAIDNLLKYKRKDRVSLDKYKLSFNKLCVSVEEERQLIDSSQNVEDLILNIQLIEQVLIKEILSLKSTSTNDVFISVVQDKYGVEGLAKKVEVQVESNYPDEIVHVVVGKDVYPLVDGKAEILIKQSKSTKKYKKIGYYRYQVDWLAYVQIKRDKDTLNIPFRSSFLLVKPMLQAESSSLTTLYRGSSNMLNIKCPVLGEGYNPLFLINKPDTNHIKKARGYGVVNIEPYTDNVTVDVYQGDTLFLGQMKFDVKDVPDPDILFRYRVRGKVRDRCNSVSLKELDNIYLSITPDQIFKINCPRDARYIVSKYTLYVEKDGKELFRKDYKTKSVRTKLPEEVQAYVEEGSILYCDVTEIVRKNYLNKKIKTVTESKYLLSLDFVK